MHTLVEAWLTKFGDLATFYLVTNQYPPNLSYHVNYDGVKCWVLMSNLLAESAPATSAALFRHAEETMEILWGYSGLSAGPDERPFGAPGYYNYNIGPRMMMDDPRSDPALVENYGRIAANFARGSAYSECGWTINYRLYRPADGSWPDSGINSWDPDRPPDLSRPFALGILSHLIADDIYAAYDLRQYGDSVYTYLQAHNWYIPEFLSRWFLGFDSNTGLDRPYRACVDQWRDIDSALSDNGGDFSMVPASWEKPLNHHFTPFMFAHTSRMLMYAYDHAAIVGHQYQAIFRAKILLAVSDLCDISLRWFSKPTVLGNTALVYTIPEGGIPPTNGAADLSLFEMSMFAWSAKMTGNEVHRDFAISLAETGIAEGYWVWGKHWNQGVIEAYNGFGYLGFLSEENGTMPIDIAALRLLVDKLETEAAQAVDAKADLESAQGTVAEAQGHLTEATTAYTKENDERLAAMQEIITLLQTGMVD